MWLPLVKPVSKFNLDHENELLACCHYTNLQPLLQKDNIQKGNIWHIEDDIFWNENIRGKEYYKIYVPS